MRRNPLAIALIAATALATPTAAAALPDGPISVPGQIVALRSTADGGLDVLAVQRQPGGEPVVTAPVIHHIRADGSIVVGAVAPRLTAAARSARLIADGLALAIEDVVSQDGQSSSVVARSLAADGTTSPDERISTPGRDASGAYDPVVGPTGAVAVTFSQRQGERSLQRLAFRPAGAPRFLPPRTLGRAAAESTALFLGPDGGGLVVQLGGDGIGPTRAPVQLRRITPDGRLGKTFRLRLPGKRLSAAASGAFAGRTFALALNAEMVRGDDIFGRLFTTSLAPGARRTTPVQSVRGTAVPADPVPVTATPRGTVALLATLDRAGQRVYEGRPGRLCATARIATRGPLLSHLTARPDGGLASVWFGLPPKGRQAQVQFAVRAAGERRFTSPRAVPGFTPSPDRSGYSYSEQTLTQPAVLPGGGFAVGYNQSVNPDEAEVDGRVLIVR